MVELTFGRRWWCNGSGGGGGGVMVVVAVAVCVCYCCSVFRRSFQYILVQYCVSSLDKLSGNRDNDKDLVHPIFKNKFLQRIISI